MGYSGRSKINAKSKKSTPEHGKLSWRTEKWCAPVPAGGSDPILNS